MKHLKRFNENFDSHMNEAGHAGDGENLCPPMCSYCYNNWTEIND